MLVRSLPNGVNSGIADFLDQNIGERVVSDCAGEKRRAVFAHHPLADAQSVERAAAGDEFDRHLLDQLLIERKMALVGQNRVVGLKAVSIKKRCLT